MKRLSVLCLFCLAGQSASGFDGINLTGSSATQVNAQAAADAATRAAATRANQAAADAATRAAASASTQAAADAATRAAATASTQAATDAATRAAAAASTRSATDAATRAAATTSTQAATDAAARASISASGRTATEAAARQAASASTRLSTDAAVRATIGVASDAASGGAARAALQSSQRAATDVAASAAQRSSVSGAAAGRMDSTLRENGMLGLSTRTDVNVQTHARGDADVSTRGALFNLDALFGTSGKASTRESATMNEQSTLSSDFFNRAQTDAFDAGASAKEEVGIRANAALATQARAQSDINAGVRARLAAVDRMRDEAIETGNEALYEQADRLEAQIRLASPTRIQADGRAYGEGNTNSGAVTPVSSEQVRTRSTIGADFNAAATADGSAAASADVDAKVRGGFFSRFYNNGRNTQRTTTDTSARSQLSGAAGASAE